MEIPHGNCTFRNGKGKIPYGNRTFQNVKVEFPHGNRTFQNGKGKIPSEIGLSEMKKWNFRRKFHFLKKYK